MVGGHKHHIVGASQLSQGQCVGSHTDGGHHFLLLFFSEGTSVQADVLHAVVVEQITGIEHLTKGCICMATDVCIMVASEFFARCLLGAMVGIGVV